MNALLEPDFLNAPTGLEIEVAFWEKMALGAPTRELADAYVSHYVAVSFLAWSDVP